MIVMKFNFRKQKNIHVRIKKQTPPLILDKKWHELFNDNKTLKIRELEQQLNNLLKAQGQANVDYKEYTQLKKKLLSDILGEMPEAFDNDKNESQIRMTKNKKYIDDINKKLKKLEIKLIRLPKEIENVNSKLLEISMSECYSRMMVHKNNLIALEEKIGELREMLKTLMINKNESKDEYDKLYAYMHDLVGSEVMEEFDRQYLGGNN